MVFNPKYGLYLRFTVSCLICITAALATEWFQWNISLLDIGVQLSTAAIVLFVYALFLQSKLSESGINYVGELVRDKFLLTLLHLYFFCLLLIVFFSITGLDLKYLSLPGVKGIYVFINLFSILLVFSIYLFILQLINPMKLAMYLLSKVGVKRLINYELGQVEKKENIWVITKNIYSAPIRKEDPLIPFHEVLLVPIRQFDYRSVGNNLSLLLSTGTKYRWLRKKKTRIRFAFHLYDYVIRLQINLTNPKMYNWESRAFMRHFMYVYLVVLKRYKKPWNKSVYDLLKASFVYTVYRYRTQFEDDFISYSYQDHITLIKEIDPHGIDRSLKGIRIVFENNYQDYSKIFKAIRRSETLKHPWEIN